MADPIRHIKSNLIKLDSRIETQSEDRDSDGGPQNHKVAAAVADNLANILNVFKIFTNALHLGLLLSRSLFKCLRNVNIRHKVICYLIGSIEQLLIYNFSVFVLFV